MRAGLLNKRVTIQSYTATQDALGQESRTWAEFATRWASIEWASGGEPWSASAPDPRRAAKVKIRHTEGVTSKMRLLYGSRVLEIDAVHPTRERGEEMVLLCTEAV